VRMRLFLLAQSRSKLNYPLLGVLLCCFRLRDLFVGLAQLSPGVQCSVAHSVAHGVRLRVSFTCTLHRNQPVPYSCTGLARSQGQLFGALHLGEGGPKPLGRLLHVRQLAPCNLELMSQRALGGYYTSRSWSL
jgi:hypothetical protein